MAVTEEKLDEAARVLARTLETLLESADLVEIPLAGQRRSEATDVGAMLRARRRRLKARYRQLEERLTEVRDELLALEHQIQRHRWEQYRNEVLDSPALGSNVGHDTTSSRGATQ